MDCSLESMSEGEHTDFCMKSQKTDLRVLHYKQNGTLCFHSYKIDTFNISLLQPYVR
jgi:hypothetical protein